CVPSIHIHQCILTQTQTGAANPQAGGPVAQITDYHSFPRFIMDVAISSFYEHFCQLGCDAARNKAEKYNITADNALYEDVYRSSTSTTIPSRGATRGAQVRVAIVQGTLRRLAVLPALDVCCRTSSRASSGRARTTVTSYPVGGAALCGVCNHRQAERRSFFWAARVGVGEAAKGGGLGMIGVFGEGNDQDGREEPSDQGFKRGGEGSTRRVVVLQSKILVLLFALNKVWRRQREDDPRIDDNLGYPRADSDACPAMPCLISEPTRVPARTGRLHRIGARARLLLPCIDTRQGAKAPAATSTVEATRSDNLTLVSAAPPATPPPCPARASYRARLRPAAPTRPPPPSPAPILSVYAPGVGYVGVLMVISLYRPSGTPIPTTRRGPALSSRPCSRIAGEKGERVGEGRRGECRPILKMGGQKRSMKSKGVPPTTETHLSRMSPPNAITRSAPASCRPSAPPPPLRRTRKVPPPLRGVDGYMPSPHDPPPIRPEVNAFMGVGGQATKVQGASMIRRGNMDKILGDDVDHLRAEGWGDPGGEGWRVLGRRVSGQEEGMEKGRCTEGEQSALKAPTPSPMRRSALSASASHFMSPWNVESAGSTEDEKGARPILHAGSSLPSSPGLSGDVARPIPTGTAAQLDERLRARLLLSDPRSRHMRADKTRKRLPPTTPGHSLARPLDMPTTANMPATPTRGPWANEASPHPTPAGTNAHLLTPDSAWLHLVGNEVSPRKPPAKSAVVVRTNAASLPTPLRQKRLHPKPHTGQNTAEACESESKPIEKSRNASNTHHVAPTNSARLPSGGGRDSCRRRRGILVDERAVTQEVKTHSATRTAHTPANKVTAIGKGKPVSTRPHGRAEKT
ncbi:hypothetical protein B0H12DRAFT_1287122, partial [Mycena haematopus]